MLTKTLRYRPQAVLFDRDGTLVVDVPYNSDPERVEPMPGARETLDRLRQAGVLLGMVSNQSGVARGLITPDELLTVTARIADDLGPFDVILACPHHPDDGCRCRKPEPGMLLEACKLLGIPPSAALMVGDIGADIEAAFNAGMESVLIPTPATLSEEIAAAPRVATALEQVVDLVFTASRPDPAGGMA